MVFLLVGVHARWTPHIFPRQQPPADGPVRSQGIYCKHHAGHTHIKTYPSPQLKQVNTWPQMDQSTGRQICRCAHKTANLKERGERFYILILSLKHFSLNHAVLTLPLGLSALNALFCVCYRFHVCSVRSSWRAVGHHWCLLGNRCPASSRTTLLPVPVALFQEGSLQASSHMYVQMCSSDATV